MGCRLARRRRLPIRPYFWGGGSGGGSGRLWADDAGLHFFRTVLLPGSTLNEDGGVRAWDELSVDA